MKDRKGNKSMPVPCPFCGSGGVMAGVLTQYCFRAEHPVYTDGIDMEGATIRQMIGEMSEPPRFTVNKFRCTECGKEWKKSEYKLEKDENGMQIFVKQEKKKQR